MIKKRITYANYDDVEVSEVAHFHMSRAELIKLEMSVEGGWTTSLTNIAERIQELQEIHGESFSMTVSDPAMRAYFYEIERLVLMAYGVKDGDRFRKTMEDRINFQQSEMCSELIIELMTNTDILLAFIEGIPPANFDTSAIRAVQAAAEQNVQEIPRPDLGQPRVLTRAEVHEMDHATLAAGLADGSMVVGQD